MCLSVIGCAAYDRFLFVAANLSPDNFGKIPCDPEVAEKSNEHSKRSKITVTLAVFKFVTILTS